MSAIDGKQTLEGARAKRLNERLRFLSFNFGDVLPAGTASRCEAAERGLDVPKRCLPA